MDANGLDFGDYVRIEQQRHGVPNEFYRYKVIRQYESSIYTDVPVQAGIERSVSRAMVPVVACICCGVNETIVQNFRVEDVTYDGSQQKAEIERLNRAYEERGTSKMVRYEMYTDHEGFVDSESYCPNPECDDDLRNVDGCNFCPTCGQKVHWEPQSEEEAQCIKEGKDGEQG